MRKLLPFLVFLALSQSCKADYMPLAIYEMIIKADKIVTGTIIEMDSTTFTIQIEKSLTGDSGTITIQKFINYPCAFRWTNYEIGQKSLFFIEKRFGHYSVMSGGNEGELPIFGNKIYIRGLSVPFSRRFSNDTKSNSFIGGDFTVYGKRFVGIEYDPTDLYKDIVIIRSCFDFEYSRFKQVENWSILCKDQVASFENSTSKFVCWVYSEATKNVVKK